MKQAKKLLVMGRKKAGKTSIHQVLFSDMYAYQTKYMPFTNDICKSDVQFLGHKLRIDDCGGQDDHMNYYINIEPKEVFSNTSFLIYVFDIRFLEEEKDLQIFSDIQRKLFEFSPDANLFILLHKIDKIPSGELKEIFEKYRGEVEKRTDKREQLVKVFATSLFNETLYTAWSVIIQHLLPDIKAFNKSLKNISKIIQCDEVFLMEKSTLLKIGSYNSQENEDSIQKFEEISIIIKKFKIGLSKSGKKLNTFYIKNKNFLLVYQPFSANTMILMIFYNTKVKTALVQLNIQLAQNWLERQKMDETKTLGLEL